MLQRAEALEAWADQVDSAELKEADTETLRAIAELAEMLHGVDEQLTRCRPFRTEGPPQLVRDRDDAGCFQASGPAQVRPEGLRVAEAEGCRVASALLMASSSLERYRAVGSGSGGRQMPL